MSTQPPESGEPEPASETESQQLVREDEEATKAAMPGRSRRPSLPGGSSGLNAEHESGSAASAATRRAA